MNLGGHSGAKYGTAVQEWKGTTCWNALLECLVSKPCNHATAQTRPHGKVATNSPPYLRRGRVAALSMPHGFTSSGWGFIIGSTASKYGASSGGGRCRWGPQVVGLCDVSFAPFSQQAAPHTPELHGQRAQKKRTSEESHRPCTCEPRCHRGGAEWAGRQQVPERKRTKGGGHSSRGPTASAASGSQTSRNIPPAPMQHCRIRNAARNHTGHCAGC